MYVNFISIDKPSRWSQWNSGATDSVYYSDFFKTKTEAKNFIETVKVDYPDSNLDDDKGGHEYHIKFVTLSFNKKDEKGFETLCRMMRAYHNYKDR